MKKEIHTTPLYLQKDSMGGCVYLLASKKNGTLYIGVTNNVGRRIYEHKQGFNEGFTKQYNVKILVYYEKFASIIDAIDREKQLKKWNRKRKIELIEKHNPQWEDLYHETG